MSNRFKTGAWICLFVFIMILSLCTYLYLNSQGIFHPYLKLKGSPLQQVELNEIYQEAGIHAKWKFKDVTQQVQIRHELDTSKIGTYPITYQFMNQSIQRIVEVVDGIAPIITLNGMEEVIVFQNEAYEELGVIVSDNSQVDVSQNITITHQVNTNKIGDYEVLYEVCDASQNTSSMKRIVHVVKNPQLEKLHYHYDEMDNTMQGWWFHKAKDHERKPPTFDEQKMKQYDAIYLGEDEKVIYLTYDSGGNQVSYIKEITDILNHHEIKATYFFTRNYVIEEADFMRELVKNGHVIANHTRNHYSMSDYANEQGMDTFVSEITDTQKAIYETTQVEPPMIFRFPKGEYSERSLAMVHDLGYQSVFWSHAYHDYGKDVAGQEAYNNLITHLHNGAIYLLHPSNKGNLDSLNDFIEEVKKQGYRFDVITSIKKQNETFLNFENDVK